MRSSFAALAIAASAFLLPLVSAGRLPSSLITKRVALDPIFEGLDDPLPEADFLGGDEDEDSFGFGKRALFGCRGDFQCRTTVANAHAKCLKTPGARYAKCQAVCNAGFFPRLGACKESIETCGGKTCGNIANGYNLCLNQNGSKACVPFCNKAQGFNPFKNANTGETLCLATANDINNCGVPGNVCKAGYNGIGTPSCSSSTCRLGCPPGYSSVAASGGRAAYCTKKRSQAA